MPILHLARNQGTYGGPKPFGVLISDEHPRSPGPFVNLPKTPRGQNKPSKHSRMDRTLSTWEAPSTRPQGRFSGPRIQFCLERGRRSRPKRESFPFAPFAAKSRRFRSRSSKSVLSPRSAARNARGRAAGRGPAGQAAAEKLGTTFFAFRCATGNRHYNRLGTTFFLDPKTPPKPQKQTGKRFFPFLIIFFCSFFRFGRELRAILGCRWVR